MTALAQRLVTLENPGPDRPRVKPVKVQSPEPYKGSRADLMRFKMQLFLVLADADRFTRELHRVRYCFSMMKGEAYTFMEPFVTPAGVNFDDITAFLAQLTSGFSDTDEKATAARELQDLEQGNRDFNWYHT